MSRGYDVEDYGLQNLPEFAHVDQRYQANTKLTSFLAKENSVFDWFIACDGPDMDGARGDCAVLRNRIYPDGRIEVTLLVFDGAGGGHATQVCPDGSKAYAGSLGGNLCFYDPRAMRETKRKCILEYGVPRIADEGQTHVLWLNNETFLCCIGDYLYEGDYSTLKLKRLGRHMLPQPHAMKLSAEGRYIVIGSMDREARFCSSHVQIDPDGHAKQIGIMDTRDLFKDARVVRTPATLWHGNTDKKNQTAYFVSQRTDPNPHDGRYDRYVPANEMNFLVEIDLEAAEVQRLQIYPARLPNHLSSDVELSKDGKHVLSNCCMSGTICIADRTDPLFKPYRYIYERTNLIHAIPHWRAVKTNLRDAFRRVDIFSHTNLLFDALAMTGGSLLGGSYALKLSPSGNLIMSGVRDANQIRFYSYPEGKELQRFQTLDGRDYYKEQEGVTKSGVLGMHHSDLSTASTQIYWTSM